MSQSECKNGFSERKRTNGYFFINISFKQKLETQSVKCGSMH